MKGKKIMLQFWLALIVFMGSHSVVSRTGLRTFLISRTGEKIYLVAYSLLSTLLFSWLIYAAISAQRTPLWAWNHAFYWIPNILMPLACIFFVSGCLRPNPLSIMPRSDHYNPDRPPFVIAVTRHLVLWGFFLWAASHIMPNGEFPLAFMFVVFAVFALTGTWLLDKNRQSRMGLPQWQILVAQTANFPFSGKGLWKRQFSFTSIDFAGIATGLALYAVLFYLHSVVFHVLPIPPF